MPSCQCRSNPTASASVALVVNQISPYTSVYNFYHSFGTQPDNHAGLRRLSIRNIRNIFIIYCQPNLIRMRVCADSTLPTLPTFTVPRKTKAKAYPHGVLGWRGVGRSGRGVSGSPTLSDLSDFAIALPCLICQIAMLPFCVVHCIPDLIGMHLRAFFTLHKLLPYNRSSPIIRNPTYPCHT